MKKDPDDSGVASWRHDLRRQLLAAREALAPDEHAACSRAIAHHLGQWLAAEQPAVLGFCWPWRGEFDARALVTDWLRPGRRAALPVVTGKAQPLQFRDWQPASTMQADRYGIPAPVDGEILRPEAVLIPLLGFDAAGYRLGYGGGYFDRSLAAWQPRPQAIGVGFELARIADLRPQDHDRPMDAIVTEAGLYRVRAGRLTLQDAAGAPPAPRPRNIR